MNKHCYKVIFNKKRNQMMAVAEIASSDGKHSHSEQNNKPTPKTTLFKILTFSLLYAFGLANIHASAIHADPNAPKDQRPVVLPTANGLPQINIQTPSKHGVSMNQYQQMDIDKHGAIINNSRKNARTQLAGMVQGNPYLAGGEARVIVNQINSSKPSQLNGYLEIAGKRAELIIANPSGININGGGFINAAGVTLASGKVNYQQGQLQGISVHQGSINVGGNGLNAGQSDYLNILTTAARVNAAIWANKLNLVAGHNDFDADGKRTAADLPAGSEQPRVAIDTGSLGGMYAGKIYMIGTDKGVGVNLGGKLYGQQIHLSADGTLTATNDIIASSDSDPTNTSINLHAQTINNSGRISSQGKATLASERLNNQGLVTSNGELSLQQQQLTNQGSINAGRLLIDSNSISNNGQISQNGQQALNIKSDHFTNQQKGRIGQGTATDSSADNNTSNTDHNSNNATGSNNTDHGNSNNSNLPAGSNNSSNNGNNSNATTGSVPAPVVFADGHINANNIDNSGQIDAGGDINLKSNNLTNQGQLTLATLNLSGDKLDNQHGQLNAGKIEINSQQVHNQYGQIIATQQLHINGQQINNQAGKLQSGHELNLQADRVKNSNQGQISSNQNLTVNSSTFHNSQGQLWAGGQLTLTANSLINQQGSIDADSLKLNTDSLNNTSGAIRANQQLNASIGHSLTNQQGQLSSAKDLSVQGHQLSIDNSNQGKIQSGQNLKLTANDLINQGTISAGQDATIALVDDFNVEADLSAGHDLNLSSQGNITNHRNLSANHNVSLEVASIDNQADGTIQSNHQTYLSGDNVINRGLINSNGTTLIEAGHTLTNIGSGRIYGDHIALKADTLINREESVNGQNKAATIAARQRLDIGATHIINQEHALISSSGDLAIGGSLDKDHKATGMAQSLINGSGRIEASGNGNIAVSQLQNLNNHFSVEEYLAEQNKLEQWAAPKDDHKWTQGEGGKVSITKKDIIFKFDGFNKTFNRNAAKGTKQWKFTRKIYRQRVTESDPGQIIIGGNLNISGDNWLNHNSQIIVGGDLSSDSNLKLENRETQAQKRVEEDGTVTTYTYGKVGGLTGHNKVHKDNTKSYHSNIISSDQFDSPVSVVQQHAATDHQGQSQQASINSVLPSANGANGHGQSVSTLTPKPIKLPDSSLYAIKPANSGYLIETDPAFTNQKQWLGSDYMLSALGQDPQKMQKRLGDGYYEQQLVLNQIMQITGKHYLDSYQDNTAQYQALMNAGVEYAKAFNLTPGIALSAEQMSQLTTNMVWLVNETVTLPDGSTQTVLVPKVYLVAANAQLNPDGALISANNISLKNAGHIDNQGTMQASNTLSLGAHNINNSGQISGNKVGLTATDSINFNGGTAIAGEILSLKADQINLNTTTVDYGDDRNGGRLVDKVASLTVTGDKNGQNGLLSIDATHDITTHGAVISNQSQGGTTQLISHEGDINLGTVKTEHNESYGYSKDKNHWLDHQRAEYGTSIDTHGDLNLMSGHDINIRQSDLNSDKGTLNLNAGNNINIEAGRQQTDIDQSIESKSHGLLSKKTQLDQYQARYDEVVGSNLSAGNINLVSGHDIKVEGSNIVSDNGTQLMAGNDINLAAADNSYYDHEYHKTTKSGLMGASGGIGFSIGKEKDTIDNTDISHIHSGSMVGSLAGDTSIIAGHHYNQTGSSVLVPKGDINIAAQQINITAATDTHQNDHTHTYEKSGLTVAVTAPVVSAVQQAAHAAHTIGESKNGRVNAMAAMNTGYDSYKAGQSLDNLAANPTVQNANIKVSLTYGQQKSKQETHTQAESASASQIQAVGKVNLTATGAGKDSNITIIGSDVGGDKGTALSADNNINLLAAEQHRSEHSKNTANGFSAGIAVSYGSDGFSFGVTAAGNHGKGHSDGDDTTHRHSHIGSSTGNTTLTSGGDTNITGSQVTGNSIKVDAANLNIASVQDTSKYHSTQTNISADVTVGYGASGSADYSHSKINADYAAVTEQSGLLAGDGGYQVNVGGHTQLTGAIITSTDKAEKEHKNQFTTGTIGFSDLHNHSDYKGEGFGIGVSGDYGGGADGKTVDKNGKPTSALSSGIGYGHDSGHNNSTTHSGINTANITITDQEHQSQDINQLHTDVTTDNYTEHAGYIGNNFDKDKVQHELDTQIDVSKEFSQNTQKVQAEINKKKDQLKEQLKHETDPAKQQQYQDQIINLDKVNVLISMVSGGLSAPTSNVGGIIAATASPALAYEIGQHFKENGTEGSAEHLLAHAVLGAAVAAAGGNNALIGAVSAAGGEAAAPALAHWLYGKEPSDLTADEKQTVSSIVGLAGAAVGGVTGNSADITNGFQAAQNAVNNNDFLQFFSPATAAMLSKDPERRKAMQLISQIRSGNQKITLAIYGGSIAIVGGGMVAAEAGAAIYSACIANPGACTVVGVDSVDTIAGLATGAVTVNSLAPGQVVSRGKQALEEIKNGTKFPRPSSSTLHNSTSNVDNVIKESLSGKKNFTSQSILTADEALAAGEKFLGANYKEIGKPGSGVYRSADGKREFRIDRGSLSGWHSPNVPHVHFSVINTETGKIISNNHVPIKNR